MFLFCTAPIEQKKNRDRRLEADEDLIRRIGQDDQNAFRAFYESTKNSVYGYALSILKNKQNAEDVMQETYLKIRENAPFYQPQGKPMAWVITIAKNLCFMKLREGARAVQLPAEESETVDFSEVSETEDRLVLEALMNRLSDGDREIVLLHAVSGLKHREIAKVLSLPLSTVLSKYSRAMKKLKTGLAEME